MGYCVVENTPGYMPDSDPIECDTIEDALIVAESLADELEDEGYTVSEEADGLLYYAEKDEDDLGRVVEILATEGDNLYGGNAGDEFV